MKNFVIQIKKVTVRALMALGALIGLTSCPSVLEKVYGPPETVYGPPPEVKQDSINPKPDSTRIKKPELVYGPPRVFRRDTVKVLEDVYGPPVVVEPEKPEQTPGDSATNQE